MNIQEMAANLYEKIKSQSLGGDHLAGYYRDPQLGDCLVALTLIPTPIEDSLPTNNRQIPSVVEITAHPERIARLIDHTLLKPEVTTEHVRQLCREAREFEFASVCVNPVFVEFAAQQLHDTNVMVCTVVGFPLGASTTSMKKLETQIAVSQGAREIDMVLAIGQLKAKNDNYVLADIAAVVQAARPLAHVKVILETCLLTTSEIERACLLAQKAGAHYVKTSTGFNAAGATAEHVALMRRMVGSTMGVKAAGGIRDFKTALQMVQAGASRIGASASIAIVSGGKASM